MDVKYKDLRLREFLEIINNENYFWIAKRLAYYDTKITDHNQCKIELPKYFYKENFPEICKKKVLNPQAIINQCYFINDPYVSTDVHAIYYNSMYYYNKRHGQNEFRLTSFGKDAPIHNEENTGSIILFGIDYKGKNKNAICWISENLDEEKILEDWIGWPIEPGEFYSLNKQ
jgi:Restriction endonuclease EcoRII, N-terminal